GGWGGAGGAEGAGAGGGRGGGFPGGGGVRGFGVAVPGGSRRGRGGGGGGGGPVVIADTTTYVPSAEPGSRLPHAWLADGSSLYDRLGRGFTLLGPRSPSGAPRPLLADAHQRGIPLTVLKPPADYPWRDEFLLVRPAQHIAWRT